nr:MAG TPA: Protein of unknown function (DUF1134) [Caudoviricetes sp.]
MLDIGTVKTSVYARWPKELNFDEVLERLIDESPKLLQGVAVHWETAWDSHEDENGGHWTIFFRAHGSDAIVPLEWGKGVKIEFGQAYPIERIGWRGAGVLRVGEAYRLIGRAYDLSRIEDLYELNRRHDVRLEKMRLVIDGQHVHEDYGTVVEIVGDEKLYYDVDHPSPSELREKYLPIYDKITNN